MTEITCYPVKDRWDDLEKLFGPSGAYWGCWCTYFILKNKRFNEMKSESRKEFLKKRVQNEKYSPGIIAYKDNNPVGWLAMNPKENYMRLIKSRVIKSIDDKPVWSIVCFFIHKDYRGQGISNKLLEYAILYAREQGANLIESYPIECKKNEIIKADYAYVGLSQQFINFDFNKVSNTKSKSGGKPRIIMRKEL